MENSQQFSQPNPDWHLPYRPIRQNHRIKVLVLLLLGCFLPTSRTSWSLQGLTNALDVQSLARKCGAMASGKKCRQVFSHLHFQKILASPLTWFSFKTGQDVPLIICGERSIFLCLLNKWQSKKQNTVGSPSMDIGFLDEGFSQNSPFRRHLRDFMFHHFLQSQWAYCKLLISILFINISHCMNSRIEALLGKIYSDKLGGKEQQSGDGTFWSLFRLFWT